MLFAENERLAVLELYDVVVTQLAVGRCLKSSVIEDRAVLQDLYERRTFVSGGSV